MDPDGIRRALHSEDQDSPSGDSWVIQKQSVRDIFQYRALSLSLSLNEHSSSLSLCSTSALGVVNVHCL